MRGPRDPGLFTILFDSTLLNCPYFPPQWQERRMPSTMITSVAHSSLQKEQDKMKVGVLGSGDVAKVLAGGFLKHGHDVMLVTRTPSKLADCARPNPQGSVGRVAEA